MLYIPNSKAKKYVKQKLIKQKGDIDKSTVIIGDFTLLSTTDRKLHRKSARVYVLVYENFYNNTTDLNNRNSFSHSSGVWKSKIKVSAGLISSKAFLACRWPPSHVSSHGLSFVVHISLVSLLIRIPVLLD